MNRNTFRSPLVILGILATGVVVGIAGTIVVTDPPSSAGMDVDARADGAGTYPDGVADEFREGMGNETSADDFIDNSASTDALSPLLEAEDGTPPPKTDATNLEDAPDRMVDEID